MDLFSCVTICRRRLLYFYSLHLPSASNSMSVALAVLLSWVLGLLCRGCDTTAWSRCFALLDATERGEGFHKEHRRASCDVQGIWTCYLVCIFSHRLRLPSVL